MAPTTARTAEPGIAANPVQTLGMAILVPYLFVIYSRIFDIRFGLLHIPGVMLASLIILIPASAQALKVVGNGQIGRYFTLFTLWTFAVIPFAVWRRGALDKAIQLWPRALLVFLAIACMAASLPSLRRAIYAIGIGIAVLGTSAKLFGDLSTGRLKLPRGEFANSNDLAMVLLLGCPLLLFVVMEAGFALKVAALAGMIPIFWALIHTGSRAGMVGFAVMVIFLFFRCSIAGKLLVGAGGIAILAAAFFLLPHTILERYVTLFQVANSSPSVDVYDPDEMNDPGMELTAAESAQQRYQILVDSFRITFHHPIFGVGLGNFTVERDALAKAERRHVPWHEAHNAFTQVSSETGLVGFFFYMGAFIGTIRILMQLRKFAETKTHPQWKTISRMVFCLQTSLVSYAMTSFFAPVAYLFVFPTLAGLALALAFSVEPAFAEWRKQQKKAPTPDHAPALSLAARA